MNSKPYCELLCLIEPCMTTGSIPADLGLLRNLKELVLCGNQLTGVNSCTRM